MVACWPLGCHLGKRVEAPRGGPRPAAKPSRREARAPGSRPRARTGFSRAAAERKCSATSKQSYGVEPKLFEVQPPDGRYRYEMAWAGEVVWLTATVPYRYRGEKTVRWSRRGASIRVS